MTTRLNVNINDECSSSIQAYAKAHDITVTEAIRRAISLLNYFDVQQVVAEYPWETTLGPDDLT